MKFGKTVLSAIAALYLSITGAGGLTANTAQAMEPAQAKKVLKTKGEIVNLRGHWMRPEIANRMRRLAGIESGDIKPKMEGKKLFFVGDYNEAEHPEALESVLKTADENDDGVVTPKEFFKAKEKIYKNTPVGNTNLAHVIDTINASGRMGQTTNTSSKLVRVDVNGDGIHIPKRHKKRVKQIPSKPIFSERHSSGDVYKVVTSRAEFEELMKDPENRALWSHWQDMRKGLEDLSQDGVLNWSERTFLVTKNGKLDPEHSFDGYCIKGWSCNGKPFRKVVPLGDGTEKVADVNINEAGYHIEFKDIINWLAFLRNFGFTPEEIKEMPMYNVRSGEGTLDKGRITNRHGLNSGSKNALDGELADIMYKCPNVSCTGTNGLPIRHLTDGHQLIRDRRTKRRLERHIMFEQPDPRHPLLVSLPDGTTYAFPGVPLMISAKHYGMPDDSRAEGGEKVRKKTVLISRDTDLPDEDKGKKKADGRKVEITKVGDGKKKEGAGEHDNDAYLGMRGLVSASDLVPDNVAGGGEIYFGNRISDSDWSFELSFGYLAGGSESNTRDLTTAPNPNDPRERDIIFTGTERISSDYHILVPRFGFAYDATENLRLGLRFGADIVLKNTNTTIDERLEYLNGELAGTPNHESHFNRDITAMPGASFTLDYQILDNTSLSFEVNGATDGKHYNVGGGVGLTFEWEW